MAEGPAHRHFAGVVPAVAYIDALAVVGGHAVAGIVQVAGRVLQPQGPGLRQAAAGVGVAPQQGIGGLTHALARQVHTQNRRYIVRPGAFHRGACVQHDHGVFLHGGHAGNQVVLAVGQAHMAAVRALALKAVGQARKNHGHIGGFGGGHGPQKLSFVPLVAVCGEALDIADAAVVHDGGVHRADGRRVHMAGSAALIARMVGKRADVGHLLPFVQRQRTQVAQQHGALLRQLHGQLVVRRVVKHGGQLCQIGRAQHNVQNAGHSFV